MRVVVQKVSEASVEIDGAVFSSIGKGLCILAAFTGNEDDEVLLWMAKKLLNLRIFPDNDGKMNLSALDIGGSALIISNFTLYGDARKGFRPSFTGSGNAIAAEPIYDKFVDIMKQSGITVNTGIFGAMMNVQISNDGPVTLIIDKD